jgi:hypothetical protein
MRAVLHQLLGHLRRGLDPAALVTLWSCTVQGRQVISYAYVPGITVILIYIVNQPVAASRSDVSSASSYSCYGGCYCPSPYSALPAIKVWKSFPIFIMLLHLHLCASVSTCTKFPAVCNRRTVAVLPWVLPSALANFSILVMSQALYAIAHKVSEQGQGLPSYMCPPTFKALACCPKDSRCHLECFSDYCMELHHSHRLGQSFHMTYNTAATSKVLQVTCHLAHERKDMRQHAHAMMNMLLGAPLCCVSAVGV